MTVNLYFNVFSFSKGRESPKRLQNIYQLNTTRKRIHGNLKIFVGANLLHDLT